MHDRMDIGLEKLKINFTRRTQLDEASSCKYQIANQKIRMDFFLPPTDNETLNFKCSINENYTVVNRLFYEGNRTVER